MTVQVYVCGWKETTRRGRRWLEPELAVPGESFTVIDLRPDKTVPDGLCLFARVDDGSGAVRPTRQPGQGVPVAAGALLRGNKGDTLGPVARRLLGNKLGMDLSAIEDMRMFIAEVVHIGPALKAVNGGNPICIPTKQNRLETWLGGELVHDIPAVAGGAFTEPFTYSDSSLSAHSPWSDVYGTAKVVSNKCQPNFAGSFDVAWYGTASASADMYCQASFDTLNGDSGMYNFLAVRIRCDSTAVDTGIQWEAGWATSASINQFNMIVFTAGANSVVGSWGSSDQVTGDVMPARPFTAKIQGNGSSLSGYMGAQGPFNVTDSSHSTKTRSGLMVYSEGYASSSDPRVKMDNWEAGPLATAYTKSVSGAGTPSGTLNKQTQRKVTSGNTPAGVVRKQPARKVTSTTTPSGTVVKQPARKVTSTTTPSGLVTKRTSRLLMSTTTPSGTATKVTSRLLMSTTTPSGALAAVRQVLKSLAGSVSSSGALAKRTSRALTGSATSAGAVSRLTSRTLTSTTAPSGALAAVRSFLRTLTGTVTSSGALTKRTNKTPAGTVTSAGAITRAISRTLTGSVASAGALAAARTYLRTLTGSVASAGTLLKRTSRSLMSATTPSGVVTKLTSRLLMSITTPSGVTSKVTSRSLMSTTTSSGSVSKVTSRSLMSVTTPSGAISRMISRTLTGSVAPTGAATKMISRILSGSVASSGLLAALHNIGTFLPLARLSRAVADVIRSIATPDRTRSRTRRHDNSSRSDPG